TGQRVHRLRQRVHVRALQLVQLAVLEDESWNRVPLCGQLLQHARIRGRSRLRLADDGQLQLVEQDRAQLRRGADVELLAGDLEDLLRRELQRALELPAHLGKEIAVDQDAVPLYLREHGQQRHLDLAEELHQLVALQLLGGSLLQPERQVGLLAAVLHDLRRRDLRERPRFPSFPCDVLERAGPVLHVLDREAADTVVAAARIDDVRRDRDVVVDAAQRHARSAQHQQVELEVLADLENRRIFEQLYERLQRRIGERRKVGGAADVT